MQCAKGLSRPGRGNTTEAKPPMQGVQIGDGVLHRNKIAGNDFIDKAKDTDNDYLIRSKNTADSQQAAFF